MKKLVSILLCIAMLFVCAVLPVSAATTNENANYAVTVLNSLDILIGDETGDLALNRKITRAEFATILTRVLDINANEASIEFTDVERTHWAYDSIAACTNLNIINGCGDNTFKPDSYVSYEEAIKMIMCALGYEPLAAAKGGWPTGYLVAANQAKVLEGVSAKATREDIAQLVYNALSTPKMSQISYGSDEEFSILDGKNGRDYETLLTDRDIYIVTGIVGETTEDEIEISITENSKDFEFYEDTKEDFIINGSNIEDYEHNSVTAYVEKTKRKTYKIICVLNSEFGNLITINSDNIKDIEDNKVEYYVDDVRTKVIKLDKDFTMEKNKSVFDGSLKDLEDCEITFIENTGNNYYDKVIISKYVSARVDAVYPEKDRISIDGASLTFDFEDENTKIVLIDIDGNVLDLYDFEEDDVVAILSDNNIFNKYDKYIKIVKLTDASIVGEVEETFVRNNKNYVVINGEEYADSSDKSLSVGDMGTFYIGITNAIVDFDGSVAANDYAYILDAEKSKETFSKDVWQVKLLTNNGIKVYTLTNNASDNFDESMNKIITYKTNAQGKISKIEEVKGVSKEFKGEYNSKTQMIDGIVVEDYSAIFNLTSSDIDKSFCTDISYLTDESYYEGYALKVDGEYEVFVVTKGKSQYVNENGFAIVTKITSTKDNNDDEIYKVSIVENENEKTIYFNEESNTDYSTVIDSDLPIGSVIVYNAQGNIVLDYIVLGTIEDGIFVNLIDENINAEFDEDVKFVYGYISNEKRNKVSAGESITISENTVVVVTNETNKYTYNDANSRNTVVEIGNFLAEDAYYKEDNNVTPVFIKIVDGDLIDIYTFNKRVSLE